MLKRILLSSALLFSITFLSAQLTKLVPNNSVGDRPKFGTGCAASGDLIVVGSIDDDEKENNNGAAFVFRRSGNNWVQEAKLLPSVSRFDYNFGESVATNGIDIAVGSTNGNITGSVFIFRKSGNAWQEVGKLDGNQGSGFFGSAIAMSNDWMFVCANRENQNMSVIQTGAVYIYQKVGNTWTFSSKITSPNRVANGFFGSSVSLDGDYVLIGASGDKGFGQAYTYKRNGTTWALDNTFNPNGLIAGDGFGTSVALSGNFAIVTAPFRSENGVSSGSAYVFKRNGNTWTQLPQILPSNLTAGDNFGDEVRMVGAAEFAVLSGPGDNEKGFSGAGTAWVFRRQGDNWIQDSQVFSNDPNVFENFGLSMGAAFNGTVVIGAPGDNQITANGGAVFVLKLNVTTGLEEIETLSEKVEIFPNPADSYIMVNLEGLSTDLKNSKQSTVQILDFQGKKLWEGAIETHRQRIATNFLPIGIYVLAIETDGTLIARKTFVKE